jgi:hypothetical protein
MQLATDVRITLYTGYLLLAYVLWDLLVVERGRWTLIPRLMVIPVLAALLGAAQFLPLLELAGHSNRALSLADAGSFSLTPLALLVGLLLPDVQGGHEMVVYLGLVSLGLALLGLKRADRRTWFFGGVVLFAILYALGPATPLFELIYRWVPGFRWLRAPARVFLPASLAVGILAGIGMQRLAKGRVHWSATVALSVGLLTLGLGLGLAVLYGQSNRAAVGLIVLPSITLLLIGLIAKERLPARLGMLGLTLLVFADLASFDVTGMRFISTEEAFADGAVAADYLSSQPGLFRTYSPSYSLPSHVAASAGLETADGVEGVHLAVYDRFMSLAGGYGDPRFSVTVPPFPPDLRLDEAFRDTQPDLRLLGLLNVEYLAAAFPMNWSGLIFVARMDGIHIYRNQYALPRAWVVPSLPNPGGSWATQLVTLADQSARAIAIGDSVVRVTRYEPDRIVVEAQLSDDGVLVLGEIWYPGWRAMVDGERQPVEPVAEFLRGVPLTPGDHRVVLIYDPASVRWGGRISLAGWLALGLGGLILLFRRFVRARS